MNRIPVAGPWITQKEIDYVTDAVTNAWFGNANVYHERFEKAFAEYAGTRFAIALPSCTSGIHLSLAALGIGPGDEVVVPDVTWIASAAPVSYVGATPVFADIDPETLCLSANSFEACVTPKTKAVIPVDLYGNMPDMDAIVAVARARGIAVVEDAAAAVGAEYKGRKAGTFGDTGVFSFHGSKTLTTGEGGMLVTDREDIYQRCLVLRDHGRAVGDKMFRNTEIGYKYKMSSMQAALGLAQLERVNELVERKREIFSWYAAALSRYPGLVLNHEAPGTKHAYWMVTVVVEERLGRTKDTLIGLMAERGVDCRPVFDPLSSLRAYRGLVSAKAAQERNRISYAISPYGLNLPSGFNLDEATVRVSADALGEVIGVAPPKSRTFAPGST